MNAYGPRQSAPSPYGSAKVRKIVPSFITSALSDEPMRLYGGGTQYSDTVWVGDVAKVFVTALEEAAKGNVPNHPIDVGNATPYTVLEVAQEIQKHIPGASINSIPMRTGEPHGGALSTPDDLKAIVDAVSSVNPELSRIDIQRVTRELGTVVSADPNTLLAIGMDIKDFKPLSEGIAETVQWFKDNEGITWHKPVNSK
jgi:UDP-glucose 4-epimerase